VRSQQNRRERREDRTKSLLERRVRDDIMSWIVRAKASGENCIANRINRQDQIPHDTHVGARVAFKMLRHIPLVDGEELHLANARVQLQANM
jgi:hypothetical protein